MIIVYKLWLWYLLGVNGFILVSYILQITNGTLSGTVALIYLLMQMAMVASVSLLLFKKKKLGLYLLILISCVNLGINIWLGNDIRSAIISAIRFPCVTLLLILWAKSDKNEPLKLE